MNNWHYRKKHSPGTSIDPGLKNEITKKSIDGKLSCEVAMEIAGKIGLKAKDVGVGADILELRITKCILGLFGTGKVKKPRLEPLEHVSDELKRAVLDSLVDGCITCARIWNIADRLKISRIDTARACETMKIKITKCQLGAFR